MPKRRMPWFKVHTSILSSSINYELTDAEFGVFVKILALAADLGGSGIIADGDGRALPLPFISNRLCTSQELTESTIKKCVATNRLKYNGDGIEVLKWKEYQSEYNRQKPYREAKKEGRPIHKKCLECGHKEFTSDIYCPECKENGREVELQKDYKAGKFGHMIKS